MMLTINQNEENITCIAGPNPFYKALKNRIPWTKAANNDQEIMWFLLVSTHQNLSQVFKAITTNNNVFMILGFLLSLSSLHYVQ